jgi:hypothetical protein
MKRSTQLSTPAALWLKLGVYAQPARNSVERRFIVHETVLINFVHNR